MTHTQGNRTTRRMFIGTAGVASTGLAAIGVAMPGRVGAAVTTTAAADDRMQAPEHDTFPAQNPQLVQGIVGASHGNMERVRELVDINPGLARASWDWGFGDWESALGAAAHTGSREIALLLMEHGARPNIFSAAMLGQLDAVKGFIALQPNAHHIPGPHGIPLIDHARFGGEQAKPVLDYLESLQKPDEQSPEPELTEAQLQQYVGVYAFGESETQRIEIVTHRRGGLGIILPGASFARRMRYHGNDAFAPSAIAATRVQFDRPAAGSKPDILKVLDLDPVVVAVRVAG